MPRTPGAVPWPTAATMTDTDMRLAGNQRLVNIMSAPGYWQTACRAVMV
jgi:hypothetical protein